MLTQLDPAIPLHVRGKGDGFAFAVIDSGEDHDLVWVTAIDATGLICCAPNTIVRMHRCWTMGMLDSAQFAHSGEAEQSELGQDNTKGVTN